MGSVSEDGALPGDAMVTFILSWSAQYRAGAEIFQRRSPVFSHMSRVFPTVRK